MSRPATLVPARVHQVSLSSYLSLNLTAAQLDADVLDGEIESLFSSQLRRTMRLVDMLAPGAASLQPELMLLIRYHLIRHSLISKSATLGQQLLDLRLVDSGSHDSVSSSRLVPYGLFLAVAPYVQQRCVPLLPHKQVSIVTQLLTLAQLVNFVTFLTNGRYRSLCHRLLSIVCTHSSAAAIFTPVNYDFMSREVLWYSFAEFLSFLLPLVNPVKIRNFFTRLFSQKGPGISLVSPGIRCKSDLMTCAVCNQSPVNAREIGCNHCFCYYCVVTSCIADQSYGFSCPRCKFHIRDSSEIRELYLKGF